MRHRVVLALALLAMRSVPGAMGAEHYHTNPACWDEPRIYHPGPPAADIAERVHLVDVPAAATTPGEPTLSPNGAYRFWVRNPDTSVEGPWGAGLIVDVERPTRPTLLLEDVAQPISPRWLNEKLIFVRVVWGRIAFSDLILDVEKREILYHEEARAGRIAFEQYRRACGGRCPCDNDAGELAPLPVSKPGPGALIGLLEMPTVFGPGETGGVGRSATPKAVPVYAEPDGIAALVAQAIQPDDVEHREIGYEAGAAVVYEQRPGWYRIGLAGDARRDGWVRAADVGAYAPLAQLLPHRLAYLDEHWNGEVWSAPEPGARVRRSRLKKAGGREEYSADVREARHTDHGLWLEVVLYEHDRCSGRQPQVADEGWVPAYSSDGGLSAWYYSRGC